MDAKSKANYLEQKRQNQQHQLQLNNIPPTPSTSTSSNTGFLNNIGNGLGSLFYGQQPNHGNRNTPNNY
jgi:hypothetical protein